ncbi:putative lipid II flippase FtsW [Neisseriaceae bacterium CLB008]|nr:putative lipid II flippase FtsW [Neisseriaceae bacterium]
MKRLAGGLLDRKLLNNGQTLDQSLLWVIALMVGFSLIMVYSASIAYAAKDGGETGTQWHYFVRQIMFVTIGGSCGFMAFKIPMRTWAKFMPYILAFSFLLLVLVLGVGREINGAKRWIHVGPFNIQPSEPFKLAVILYLSSFMTRRVDILTNFKKVWFAGIPVGLGLFLLLLEPDMGSFVIVAVVSVALLFLGGLPFMWFLAVVAIGASMIVLLILFEPYRMARVVSFLDPWADPYGAGYQLSQALIAFGRGEWFGVGLGASMDKLFYLPEAHTDFILAVIAEEFGFMGVLALMGTYVWIVLRAFSIGKRARDLEQYFSGFVAKGIGVWLGIQSFFNIGVNIGLLPTKGLTLPLISYGGSAVIVMLVCMALLLRIDWECRRLMRGYKV